MSSARVYVGGLNKYTREKDIERFFRDVGCIREISLKNGFCFVDFNDSRDAEDACYEMNGRDILGQRVTVEIAKGTPHGRDKEMWGSGGGSGGGFGGGRDRERDYHRDDRRRDYRRDDRDHGGRDPPHWLIKYGPPIRTDYRVIVENLSSRVSWQDLKNYVSKGVEVSFADAHKPKRHEAILEFASEKDMRTAIDKFDGAELNGRSIKLFEESRERKRSPRSGSGSRSRSPRSRSKSRSGSRSKRGRSKSKSRSQSPPPKDRSTESHSKYIKFRENREIDWDTFPTAAELGNLYSELQSAFKSRMGQSGLSQGLLDQCQKSMGAMAAKMKECPHKDGCAPLN